jgi:hypothetical protein
MATLNKTAILTADDLKLTVYHVPEWNGDINLIQFNAQQRGEIVAMAKKVNEGKLTPDKLQLQVLQISIVDDNRNPMFTKEDLIALGLKNGEVLDRIAGQVLIINKLKQKEDEEEKNV